MAVVSPLVIAKLISEEAAQRGAVVWDKLAAIELGNLHDAELLTEARRFKEEFVGRLNRGGRVEDIGRAWTVWKAEHYRKG
jgi:hypothetical protein